MSIVDLRTHLLPRKNSNLKPMKKCLASSSHRTKEDPVEAKHKKVSKASSNTTPCHKEAFPWGKCQSNQHIPCSKNRKKYASPMIPTLIMREEE